MRMGGKTILEICLSVFIYMVMGVYLDYTVYIYIYTFIIIEYTNFFFWVDLTFNLTFKYLVFELFLYLLLFYYIHFRFYYTRKNRVAYV